MHNYQDKFESITQFFKGWMKTNHPGTYVSWNDYRVISDDFGGGMSIELQWDDDPSESEVKTVIEKRFLGVRVTRSWGRWEHQATVHVDERACY